MAQEYVRTELLIGTEGLKKLSGSVVMVFGIGGVGSHCIEALARSGVGHLILIDNDTVSRSNINRQSIAYQSTVGQYKTKVMKERIKDIDPEIKVDIYETFVLPENLEELFSVRPDYIIDAIDTVTAKIALVEYAQKENIPIICSMGTGNKLHAELFEIADLAGTSVCPLCKVMRKELKARGIYHLKVLYSKEKPLTPAVLENQTPAESKRRSIPGSISFVPPVAGLLIAGEVIRDLVQI